MVRRIRNASCVYTGKVGARMPIRKPRVNRRVKLVEVRLSGGPLNGQTVRLDPDSCCSTLPLAPMKGWPAGRYFGSVWTTTIQENTP